MSQTMRLSTSTPVCIPVAEEIFIALFALVQWQYIRHQKTREVRVKRITSRLAATRQEIVEEGTD